MDILLRVLGSNWENGWVKKDKWSTVKQKVKEITLKTANFFVPALAAEPGVKQLRAAELLSGMCCPWSCRERCWGKRERKQQDPARQRGDWVKSLEGIWECSSWVNVDFYRLITSSKYFRKQGKTSVSYCSHFPVLPALFEMEIQAGIWRHCG